MAGQRHSITGPRAGAGRRIAADRNGLGLLHLKLFHPLDDHGGFSPLAAAGAALDLHNAASVWNKRLLDNSARPSGALVYQPKEGGNLSADQYERLKRELEEGYAGAVNAGRPLLLEGGLDWKTMGLSPKDMDFMEAKTVPPVTSPFHLACRRCCWAFPATTPMPIIRRPTGRFTG